jgi:hypothetical protein
VTEILDIDMEEIHNLISEINKTSIKLERDVRNLNNLIHVVMGEGIRYPEYRRDWTMKITNETMAMAARKHIDNPTFEYERISSELEEYREALFLYEAKKLK